MCHKSRRMKVDVRDGMKLQTIANTDVPQEPQDEG